jgi:hypothetical protein
MKGLFATLALSCIWLTLARAQLQPSAPLSVEAGRSAFVARPGVTAAYSLDSDVVQAEAIAGGFRLTGKEPGEATVVLVTLDGAHPITVTVLEPPHPRGYRGAGGLSGQTVEYGHYELRYNNSPNQATGYESITQIAGNRQITVQAMNTDSAPAQDTAPVEFPLLSYEIATPKRSLTLVDRLVNNTDLTMNQELLRGIHLTNGPWEFHAGITSMTQYQNFLLPTQRVAAAGLSRHFQLNPHSALEGNLYYFKAGSGAGAVATSGPIATLFYQYSRMHDFAATAEIGVGQGFALAGKAERDTETEKLEASFRYQSPKIASLSIYQLHGRMANVSWSDRLTKRLTGSFSASDTDVNLPQEKELVDTVTLDPVYWINKHLGITGGLTASRFLDIQPPQPGVRSAGYLIGPELLWRHAGGSFQFQQLKNSGNAPNSTNYSVTLQASTNHVMASAFFNAESETPVFAPVQSSTQPALQQLLLHESQMTQNPLEMSQFVQQTASLSAQGYIDPVAIVLAAERRQYGLTIDSSRDKEGHLSLQGLINASSGGNTPPVRLAMGSATWSRQVGLNNAVNAGFSLFRSSTGNQSQLQPVVQFSFQHQLNTVPRWIVPGRRGSIDGHVFVDNIYTQTFTRGAAPLEGVLIYLDGRRTARTDRSGYFVFHGVPWGTHSVQVDYHDSRTFYYTSSSPKEVPAGGTADFGISFAKGRIFGRFVSDAGNGLAVTLDVEGRGIDRQVNTDGDGYVEIDGLPDGTFTIHPDDSSLPPGYSLADLNDQTVTVTAVNAGSFKFVVQAQRSIAGTVELYDPATGHVQPLAGANVSLGSVSMQSDSAGRYLFRHLPAGSYTVTVTYGGKTWTRAVQLGAQPDIESGVDIMVTQPLTPKASSAAPAPAPTGQPALKNQRLGGESHRRGSKSRSSLREREHDHAASSGYAQ